MKRLIEIDALRGLAVLSMIFFHFFIDGFLLQLWNFQPYLGWPLLLVRLGQFLFLGLVGISVFLSQRRFKGQLQRGLKIFGCGLLITFATFFFYPEEYVRFGVLHLIGLSVPLLVLFKGRERWGLLLAVLIYAFSYFPLAGSTWGIPFGFPPVGFNTFDYFPIFPWLAAPFVGLWLGSWVYAGGRETPLKVLGNVPCLTWLGRHSLAVYLLHQPLLYFSLWTLSNWIK